MDPNNKTKWKRRLIFAVFIIISYILGEILSELAMGIVATIFFGAMFMYIVYSFYDFHRLGRKAEAGVKDLENQIEYLQNLAAKNKEEKDDDT